MVVSVKEILTKAKEGGYAVGAFNIFNLETAQGVIQGARTMRSPVIVQITEKTMEYAGGRAIFNLAKNIAEFYASEIPIGIHLDHGHSFEAIKRALNNGFTSVMYDGSRKKYEDNLITTKEVVEFCHEKGVDVQAELGCVPYLGEVDISDEDWVKYMTDPGQAEDFAKKTDLDALAVGIGNAHGFFKEKRNPDYDRLEMISKSLSIPLVLHGASDWENGKVVDAIQKGISCFNVDTAVRLAFVNSLASNVMKQGPINLDARKFLGEARDSVIDVVKEKIKMFGSDGKA
jgi:fructose-bisphosphate aldolase class II